MKYVGTEHCSAPTESGEIKMPKYVCKHDVKHDGKEYVPGKIIELTEEQAQAMSNAVEPYVPPEEEEKKKGGRIRADAG